MSDHSGIQWTEATWNPIVGCSIVSPGCTNCYAMRDAWRKHHNPRIQHYRNLTRKVNGRPVWTGRIAEAPEHILTAPLRWKKPRRIFVNSMGDLFHEDVPDEWIDRVFAVMAMAPQHRYQILTKRAARMRAYIEAKRANAPQWVDVPSLGSRILLPYEGGWPRYIWLGVSCERQQEADERIPHLLATPAAIRWISAEPLLGPIDLDTAWHGEDALASECWGNCNWCEVGHPPVVGCRKHESTLRGLDWVVAGGESGKGARPMHPDWARSLRNQCQAAGVPFFFKQWGAWGVDEGPRDYDVDPIMDGKAPAAWFDGERWHHAKNGYAIDLEESKGCGEWVYRLGKRRAGRLLDGREWNEYPEVA